MPGGVEATAPENLRSIARQSRLGSSSLQSHDIGEHGSNRKVGGQSRSPQHGLTVLFTPLPLLLHDEQPGVVVEMGHRPLGA